MVSQTELTTSQLPGTGATAPAGQAAVAPQGKRLLFIDNLRILLICGVLVNHLNDTYGAIGAWEYHDPVTNLLAWMRGREATVVRRVPILSGKYEIKALAQFVDYRDDPISCGNRQSASWQEIVLHVNNNQGVHRK